MAAIGGVPSGAVGAYSTSFGYSSWGLPGGGACWGPAGGWSTVLRCYYNIN